MKSFGEFKQELTEQVSSNLQQFEELVDAGVLDKNKQAKFNSVLNQLHEDHPLSTKDRQIICGMIEELSRLATNNLSYQTMIAETTDSSSVAMYHQEPPPLVVLRRKAIRMYPFNTKVALYYSDKLNRYFSVPYQDMGDGREA